MYLNRRDNAFALLNRISNRRENVQEAQVMFGIFRRSKNEESSEKELSPTVSSVDTNVPDTDSDARLIAVISAAIARFRENEEIRSDAGFIVRRVRRV